jgi:hypothetical protein
LDAPEIFHLPENGNGLVDLLWHAILLFLVILRTVFDIESERGVMVSLLEVSFVIQAQPAHVQPCAKTRCCGLI